MLCLYDINANQLEGLACASGKVDIIGDKQGIMARTHIDSVARDLKGFTSIEKSSSMVFPCKEKQGTMCVYLMT
jgi:hypothetical protein